MTFGIESKLVHCKKNCFIRRTVICFWKVLLRLQGTKIFFLLKRGTRLKYWDLSRTGFSQLVLYSQSSQTEMQWIPKFLMHFSWEEVQIYRKKRFCRLFKNTVTLYLMGLSIMYKSEYCQRWMQYSPATHIWHKGVLVTQFQTSAYSTKLSSSLQLSYSAVTVVHE